MLKAKHYSSKCILIYESLEVAIFVLENKTKTLIEKITCVFET